MKSFLNAAAPTVADATSRVSWSIIEWCGHPDIGISPRTLYNLDNPPKSIVFAGRRVIVESPQDYVRRLAKEQSEKPRVMRRGRPKFQEDTHVA